MANCVCANCNRVLDCTGETLCEICEADMEEKAKKKDPKVFIVQCNCVGEHTASCITMSLRREANGHR